jgi:hypothetical protein
MVNSNSNNNNNNNNNNNRMMVAVVVAVGCRPTYCTNKPVEFYVKKLTRGTTAVTILRRRRNP